MSKVNDIDVAGGLVLDISRQEEPVTIGGKPYVMREWLGGGKLAWERDRMKGADIIVEEGRKVIRNATSLGGSESLLVSLCLFERTDDGKERPVSQATVELWPGRVQTALYGLARKVCRLDEEEPKADPKG